MGVVGIGVDLVSVGRMARAMHRGRFLERVFTPEERSVLAWPHPEEALAARFAAKEATMKALGVPLTLGRLREVEVVRTGGAPRLHLSGTVLSRFQDLGATSLLLTLSHEREMAVAVVVVLR